MTDPKPFNDVKDVPLPSLGDVGQTVMPNVASIKIGQGDQAFKGDQSGIWLGANKFADAPFSVDMDGNIIATTLNLSAYATVTDLNTVSGNLSSLDGNALKKDSTTQVLAGKIIVGDNKITIDGVNKRIIINDGTNDRILIGYQSGGF